MLDFEYLVVSRQYWIVLSLMVWRHFNYIIIHDHHSYRIWSNGGFEKAKNRVGKFICCFSNFYLRSIILTYWRILIFIDNLVYVNDNIIKECYWYLKKSDYYLEYTTNPERMFEVNESIPVWFSDIMSTPRDNLSNRKEYKYIIL